jgi:hypothetical protein
MSHKLDDYSSVTVIGVGAGDDGEGTALLVLETAEVGPIAFGVDSEIVALLRKNLEEIELFYTRAQGKS